VSIHDLCRYSFSNICTKENFVTRSEYNVVNFVIVACQTRTHIQIWHVVCYVSCKRNF